jgi:hypothetical protein
MTTPCAKSFVSEMHGCFTALGVARSSVVPSPLGNIGAARSAAVFAAANSKCTAPVFVATEKAFGRDGNPPAKGAVFGGGLCDAG